MFGCLTSDDKPGRFRCEGVLRGEGGARDLALPQAVVERDVGLEDLEAAVSEARLARPLVLAGIDADRLEGGRIGQLVKSDKSLGAIKRNILPHPKKRDQSPFIKSRLDGRLQKCMGRDDGSKAFGSEEYFSNKKELPDEDGHHCC